MNSEPKVERKKPGNFGSCDQFTAPSPPHLPPTSEAFIQATIIVTMSSPSSSLASSSCSSFKDSVEHAPASGNLFWLTWYFSSVIDTHKHWALVVSYDAEDEAFGTAYHV